MKDATAGQRELVDREVVSIHASREGRDMDDEQFASHLEVSIHASREGRDTGTFDRDRRRGEFQSTRPVKDATSRVPPTLAIVNTFQSTRPVKDATP